MDFNPYEVLGVAPNASREEIHKAYRRLASLYHPRKDGVGDKEKAILIHLAWDILSDPTKRISFDRGDGTAPQNPVEVEARRVLAKEIANWLLVDSDENPVMKIAVVYAEKIRQHERGIAEGKKLIERTAKRIARVKVTAGINLFKQIGEDSIQRMKHTISGLERELEIFRLVRLYVMDYSVEETHSPSIYGDLQSQLNQLNLKNWRP